MSARRIVLAAAGVGAVILVSTAAQASSTSSPATIKACYRPSDGALRLALGAKCRKGWKSIAWDREGNATGVSGPRGPEGPRGPKGDKGERSDGLGKITQRSGPAFTVAPKTTIAGIASCQAGEVVTGGGWVSVQGGAFFVDTSRPTAQEGWRVQVTNPNTTDVAAQPYAMCAKV
ncbi:hypothetical protein Acor_02890 [Acrocarpospora corrugata]|uniref:Uncharacterized protein n=1 Tax=Acrocarpospora corrugata TaxID=35763 RepID=A0A5M3VV17_9ACTN|nr:hypothetical protein [Acrocarpospora corrugata]GER98227.1 hypothetical protein Acor_02890 [Acrocarpospora corrugata]